MFRDSKGQGFVDSGKIKEKPKRIFPLTGSHPERTFPDGNLLVGQQEISTIPSIKFRRSEFLKKSSRVFRSRRINERKNKGEVWGRSIFLDQIMIIFIMNGKQNRPGSLMNDSESLLKYYPFETLGKLFKDQTVLRQVPIKKPQVPIINQGTEAAEVSPPSINEESVFREAMEGIKPIVRDKRHEKKPKVANLPYPLLHEPEPDVRQQLDNLLKYGAGFIISKTPEYMEGIGLHIPPEFAERLHRGDFSIQAHLDLHGMSASLAKEAFENFLHEAIMSGKRAVLIIHGRGLSSPGEPVLKNKVSEWLTRSHWRKWVIVFTSAQAYDGGAGATYVLLRHRLKTKRSRGKLTEK